MLIVIEPVPSEFGPPVEFIEPMLTALLALDPASNKTEPFIVSPPEPDVTDEPEGSSIRPEPLVLPKVATRLMSPALKVEDELLIEDSAAPL